MIIITRLDEKKTEKTLKEVVLIFSSGFGYAATIANKSTDTAPHPTCTHIHAGLQTKIPFFSLRNEKGRRRVKKEDAQQWYFHRHGTWFLSRSTVSWLQLNATLIHWQLSTVQSQYHFGLKYLQSLLPQFFYIHVRKKFLLKTVFDIWLYIPLCFFLMNSNWNRLLQIIWLMSLGYLSN